MCKLVNGRYGFIFSKLCSPKFALSYHYQYLIKFFFKVDFVQKFIRKCIICKDTLSTFGSTKRTLKSSLKNIFEKNTNIFYLY